MLDKSLKSILPLLDSGDHYGAHQRTRTAAARLSRNGIQGQYTAIELLFIVSKSLLEKSQWASGVDVSIMMIDAMAKLEAPWEPTHKAHVTQLIGLCTSQSTWRKKLIDAAISSSAKSFNIPSGHPDILQYIGNLYYKESSFNVAEHYLMLASKKESATILAKMYMQWALSNNQYHDDVGRFALRGVLGFILAEQVECAITFTLNFLIELQLSHPNTILESQPLDGITLTQSHTLNFAQLIIACIQRSGTSNIAQEWKSLVDYYRNSSSIVNTQPVTQACAKIGSLYFDIKPMQSSGNMMDIMSSLLGGAPAQSISKRKLANTSVGELD
ncbi:hypothetical protein E3P92_01401 [Wallemia ichthyophaga]|uniref:Golgi to ER traffic protein 4 n=2 Tax=Wallemia ichthyophaga TaxID=245174 RepID=A0A4T0HQD8_WALIC|nr:golgi family to ER traffic protein 4 [Wallemia ichthyophaga EXF-994]TIA74046.1 hypothetical protein E3P91_01206 [Wallemia ichthyophaga]EOR00379.1 golgi family to ER traffic protein 4 [Wallemia ichthyophaga EXF-994]TIA82601.1 hypothetical protein E3P98_01346 [Wallemia ichthyophaga]TIA92439.1 hypothetical protein E3P97_01512 [Wallemia ichthyophaga]TIB01528.1 hypothetical protein E3P95_01348 [Wallemia ichthyophaga]